MLKFKIVITLILIVATLGFTIDTIRDEHKRKKEIAAYAPLVSLININQDDDFDTITDKVRLFINKNSIHKIDEEFRSHWGDHATIGKKIYNYATQKNDTPVHLECSSRRAVMERILQGLGYRTRSVDLYSHTPEYAAHSLLEVKNPETDTWVAQDPGFNIFWKLKATNKRISMVDIVKYGAEKVSPCHTKTMCGWEIEGFGEQAKPADLKNHLGMAVTIDRQENIRNLYYNPKIFPIKKTQPIKNKGEMSYCQYRKKNCRGEIVNVHSSKI